ncbi:MAG TPA: primosomal protein N' [Clostridia bacterium]|nr:primosomal protein N' [Clostridia bacterium]
MSDKLYAGVIVDQAHPAIDKIYHYEIPEDLKAGIQIGMRVLVPFGAGNRNIDAYIMGLNKEIFIPHNRVKPIKEIRDPYPVLLPELVPLVWWMKKEYHCLTIEAIRCFIPPGLRRNMDGKVEKMVFLKVETNIDEKIAQVESRSRYMAEILRILNEGDGISLPELADMAGGAPLSSFKNLEKRGWIFLEDQEVYRNPWDQPIDVLETELEPTKEQAIAIETIGEGISMSQGIYLLHGVTGSGKTEVYMHLVEKTLKNRKRAIILVPEISLTPQTVGHFKKRFGADVAILHSRLSTGERFDEWRRIYNRQVNIVIGARSAIFAPLQDLGLIVIDEAHDDSYKSESRPRYHTIGLAAQRSKEQGAVLVLGSATPSLDDFYNSEKGLYTRVTLDHRINYRPLPGVEIIDMRLEIKRGNRSIFSQKLYDELQGALSRGEQAIILLNRRGYAQFVSCRSCGYVVKCNNCDISMTYHSKSNVLKCHYCGNTKPYPRICPECKSTYIKHFGVGTQKVEQEIGRLLSSARIIRMDMDTTSTKGAHQRILDAFRHREYDILLGTQMVAKGLDFPNVTLVGVVTADTSLNLPDYRSSEKTFQLITQVAGRAGRGSREGKVIIQTYHPDHYAIQYSSKHDYLGFYNEEIKIRNQFKYPPFSHIVRVLITGEIEDNVIKTALDIKKWMEYKGAEDPIIKSGTIELGAYPAPLERIKNRYRWHVLARIRNERIFIERYHEIVDDCQREFFNAAGTIVVDFYPTSLL